MSNFNDLLDGMEDEEVDYQWGFSPKKTPTVGFSTTKSSTTQDVVLSTPGDEGALNLIENEGGDVFSQPLEEEEEGENDSFVVERVFHKDLRRIKEPLLQLIVHGGSRLYVPDSLDENTLFYFCEKDDHFIEREYKLPEEEVLNSRSVFHSKSCEHVLIVGREKVYYINLMISNFGAEEIKLKEEQVTSEITSVFFDGLKDSTQKSTEPILIGTKNGMLYELVINFVGVTKKSKKKISFSLQKLYDLNNKYVMAKLSPENREIGGVTGIYVLRKKKKSVVSYYLFVSCENFLFEFGDSSSSEEKESYRSIFDVYLDSKTAPVIYELPSKSVTKVNNSLTVLKGSTLSHTSIVVLSNAGIFHGLLSFAKSKIGVSCVEECELISTTDCDEVIVSICVLEFHIFVLYETKLIVYLQPPSLCTTVEKNELDRFESNELKNIPINEIKKDFCFKISKDMGKPRGLIKSYDKNGDICVYLYTSISVFCVMIFHENLKKDVWRLYLYKAKKSLKENYFNIASVLSQTRTDKLLSAHNRNIVLTEKANFYFEKEKFEKAANTYAKTTHNFEEIAIKFHNRDEKDSLRIYLLKKLNKISSQEQESKKKDFSNFTQLCCLCTWLTELYLDKLNQLKDLSNESGGNSSGSKQQFKDIRKEFRTFLINCAKKKYLHKETTFNLISSHGQMEQLIFFAKAMKEYDFVISYYIIKKKYEKALEVLVKHCYHKKFKKNWYKYIPLLIQYKPKTIIGVIRDKRLKFLDPSKLLPAIMRYISHHTIQEIEKDKEHSVIGYLQWVVRELKNKNQTIHNLLVYLYAQLKEEKKLLNFLKYNLANYNKQYALRICLENKKIESCIYLYSKMELYEDAVDLALRNNNIDLAKLFAENCSDIELTKKLWLKIAKFVIKRKNVKDSLKILYGGIGDTDLREKNPYLKFENILQYFQDDVLIDDFKKEICNSLNNYNEDIENLKKEMKDQAKDLKYIRSDIKNMKFKYHYLSPKSICCVCSLPILPNDFYMFPCNHIFHSSCLVEEVKKYTSKVKKVEIEKLINLIQTEKEERKERRKKLNEIISKECVYCGEMMINSIDKKLVKNSEKEIIMDWEINYVKLDYIKHVIRPRYDIPKDLQDENNGESEYDF